MIRYLLGCAAVALLMVNCDKPADEVDCSVMNHGGVELIYPRGTETFTVGSTVPVKFKVDPDTVGALVDITLSTDGIIFRNIFQRSISIDPDLGVHCRDTVWVVGSEWNNFAYQNSQTVKLRVEKYSAANEYSDVSGTITINKP